MKIKTHTPLLVLSLLLLFYSNAQNNMPSFYPFKGFHVGITGQTECIQKCAFVALTGSDPAPKPIWTYGWETGIEFSYHFAKYFGISLGINYGTILSYRNDIFLSTVPYYGGWKEVNKYDSFASTLHNEEILFPVKLNFHYPLSKNIFFNTEIGIKIKGIGKRINDGKDRREIYSRDKAYITPPQYSSSGSFEQTMYYEEWGIRYLSRINFDLLLGIGLYYKLPYGDLLRCTAGVNISFNPIIEGYYVYLLTKSYGTFSVKNDFIYIQLAYIHTFNFIKAKKYLKNNGFSFSSKKERRKKIIEML
jgi:hypothetical protein